MNKIERAIEHIADNVKFLQTHHNAGNSLEAHELALTALKEKLEREKNPLTCDGCDNKDKFDYSLEVGRQCPCTHCKRIAPDRYEPKGEKA